MKKCNSNEIWKLWAQEAFSKSSDSTPKQKKLIHKNIGNEALSSENIPSNESNKTFNFYNYNIIMLVH